MSMVTSYSCLWIHQIGLDSGLEGLDSRSPKISIGARRLKKGAPQSPLTSPFLVQNYFLQSQILSALCMCVFFFFKFYGHFKSMYGLFF